jgi:carbon-monoxide dehydrogenase small subunit
MQISLTVNGTLHTAEVEPRLLLVDFIREWLRLTGTKIGCDTGQCGTCIIQVDGKLVMSCAMLAVQAQGSVIETIEAVAERGHLTTLQTSLWEKHGLQCGFCTPGVVMTMRDLLRKNANPSEAEIRASLESNFCRCTGYQSIVRAVQSTVEKMQAESQELLTLASHD